MTNIIYFVLFSHRHKLIIQFPPWMMIKKVHVHLPDHRQNTHRIHDLVFEPAADGRILQALSSFYVSSSEVDSEQSEEPGDRTAVSNGVTVATQELSAFHVTKNYTIQLISPDLKFPIPFRGGDGGEVKPTSPSKASSSATPMPPVSPSPLSTMLTRPQRG